MNGGPILLAAVGAGVGGGLGGLILMFANMVRGRPTRIGPYLALALAVLGAQLATITLPQPPPAVVQLDAAGPAYRAIQRYYPDVFAQMTADAKGIDHHAPLALQNKLRPRLAALMAEHRTQMDDTSVNALGRLMLDETLALRASSPQACVAILGGGPSPLDIGAAFSPELSRRDGEVTAQILEQVATHPATPPAKLSTAETMALIDEALKELSGDERKLVAPMLQHNLPPATGEEAVAFCAFYRDLFTTAMRGPDQTLRRFLAG